MQSMTVRYITPITQGGLILAIIDYGNEWQGLFRGAIKVEF